MKRNLWIAVAWWLAALSTVAMAANKKPMQPQLFHTLEAGGGLIEGSCIGVQADQLATVKMADGTSLPIPLELFEAADRAAICRHFDVQPPAEAAAGDAPPNAEQHPWHSLRGGVMAMGKIVETQGVMLIVIDKQGKRLRIPYALLAEGAKTHADRALATVDPDFSKRLNKSAGRKATPPANSRVAKAKSAAPNKTQPAARVPNSSVTPATPAPTAIVAQPAAKPIDAKLASRKWTSAKGDELARGKFVQRDAQGQIIVAKADKSTVALTMGELSPDDQRYVAIVLAGGRPDELNPEMAQGPSRKWKMHTGMVMGEGKFLELRNNVVNILTSENRKMPLPMDLLSASDRQLAETLASGGQPTAAPAGAIVVESDAPRLLESLDRKSMLLIDNRKLLLLSANGEKLLATKQLPAEITQLQERTEYYVAAAGTDLVLLNKDTLQTLAKYELWKYRAINRIALHPTRKVAFLSIENNVDEVRANADERQHVVMVDEQSGDIEELEGIYATWLTVDPQGKCLFAGYKDVTQKFGGLHMNPGGQIIEVPKYQNTDILRRYAIGESDVQLEEEFRGAGANGQGLALSPSGNQVSYLSFTGYPTYSGNVCLFNTASFKRKPVILAMKDVADCKRLTFHPIAKLAASPAKSGAVLFDTETGKPSSWKLTFPEQLHDCAIHDFAFSPDGKRLVFIVSQGGGDRYVVAAPIKP